MAELQCRARDVPDALMFDTPNLPCLCDIDSGPLISEWKANGHKQGASKGVTGDSADSAPKDAKRIAANKSAATFLFEK